MPGGHLLVNLAGRLVRKPDERRVLLAGSAGRGDHAVKVFADHRDRARKEISEIVRKIRVDAVDQRLVREYAVRAEGDLAQQEIADRVHAVTVAELDRIDHVAL